MTVHSVTASLMILATTTALSSDAMQKPIPQASADPVTQTMTAMRLLSTFVVDQRRREGGFRLADGKLHAAREVLGPQLAVQSPNLTLDGWGHPLWYRAGRGVHEVISYGADGRADQNYDNQNLYAGRYQPIIDALDSRNDLVLIDGRFVRRPFGSRSREFATINAINAIYSASASFAVDNNRFPGSAVVFKPVSEIVADLVPVYIHDMPVNDGWGRPLLYSSNTATFILASFGEDGIPESSYYTDLLCGLAPFDPGPSVVEGGDVVQICGAFTTWPRGTEP